MRGESLVLVMVAFSVVACSDSHKKRDDEARPEPPVAPAAREIEEDTPAPNDEPPAPPPRHAGFEIAKLKMNKRGKLVMEEWQSSTEVFPQETLDVVVMATWCPHCDELKEKIRTDVRIRNRVDALLFYETELEHRVQRELTEGRITADEAAKYRKTFKRQKLFLEVPEFFEGNTHVNEGDKSATAAAGVPSAPVYIIRDGQFEDILEGVPTAIRCTPKSCDVVDRPDQAGS